MSVSSPVFLSRNKQSLTARPSSAHLAPVTQPIANFGGGSRVRIVDIKGDEQLCHRLLTMGIFPGREVQILRKQGQSLMLRHGHMCLGVRLSPSFVIEAEEAR